MTRYQPMRTGRLVRGSEGEVLGPTHYAVPVREEGWAQKEGRILEGVAFYLYEELMPSSAVALAGASLVLG